MRHTFPRLSNLLCLGVVVGSGAAVLGAAGPAHAQPSPKGPVSRACGESAIPLVVGNEWTYQPVAIPGGPPPDPNDYKKNPQRAKKIVIDVVGVNTQNGVTTVQLSEDIDGHKLATSITCAADKFTASPDSFFFAGEPGGFFHLDLTDFQHKDGTTLKLVGGKLTGPDWRDDVTGTWAQTATAGADPKLWKGKVEMERHFKIEGPDNIVSAAGSFNGATRVALEITGRITLDPPDPNPAEFPAELKNWLWFADNIGVVQVRNSYGHMYQLTAMKLAK